MKRLAIFASGTGSNANNIIKFFEKKEGVEVGLILSGNEKANVINIARENDIQWVVLSKTTFNTSNIVVDLLYKLKIDFVILAGFLWKIPLEIIDTYPNKIVNIHPSLLPKYGGKGMYGKHVHEAVLNSGDVETGITIHFVNDKYDEGEVISQKRCAIQSSDTIADIANKVHKLEYSFYPQVINSLLNDEIKSEQYQDNSSVSPKV